MMESINFTVTNNQTTVGGEISNNNNNYYIISNNNTLPSSSAINNIINNNRDPSTTMSLNSTTTTALASELLVNLGGTAAANLGADGAAVTLRFDGDNGDNGTVGSMNNLEPEYNWPVLFFFVIVVMAIGGNVLVCLAVRCERKLHNMFNFFLVSLALSDMLSAILVMPLSIVKAFIVNLPIPKLMCVTWYSLDVLFTSSTIIHLCMISVDRYMSLQYPLRYGHTKRTKDTVMKIIAVWILSFCISGPLFIFSMFDKQDRVYFKGCGPETPTFVISATVSSFFLPLFIMTVMYILTVRALHRQRRDTKGITTSSAASSYRTTGAINGDYNEDSTTNTTVRTSPYPSPRLSRVRSANTGSGDQQRYGELYVPTSALQQSSAPSSPLNGHGTMMEYTLVPSTTDAGFTSSCTDIPLDELTSLGGGGISRKGTYNGKNGGSTNNSLTLHHKGRRSYTSKNQRKLRQVPSLSGSRKGLNSLDKGRKAVQVLGILFAVFVLFYLPFFLMYLINGTCDACQKHISPQLLTALEWLAYTGSMVNPIVYHIFNSDFQRAFHKLLRCKWRQLR